MKSIQTRIRNAGFSWLIALLGLLPLGIGSLQAQSNLNVTVQLTVRTQGTNTQHGNVITSTIQTIRFGTKDLLQILASATANDFTNAKLVRANLHSDSFLVIRGTNVLADVTSFFTEQFNASVSSGSQDQVTSRQNFHNYFTQQLGFDNGPGNNFNMSGGVTETYTTSPKDTQGNQKVSEKMVFIAAGEGSLAGHFGVFTGTITTLGTGIVSP